ncbi:hypothetical protein PybrP1_007375 [[Pythium] brassicae (nom. inval.)]|nr:hypothetical protein PybrP1_007375 [[Pythium] brassicae (nom. inval.)]
MQLLRGAAEVQEQLDAGMDATGFAATSGGRFRVTLKKLRLFLRRKLYPFATDVRHIEARFGYSVASYFRFFRWIIMSFIAISLPCCAFLVLHILYMTAQARMAPRFLTLPGYSPDEGLMYSASCWYLIILLTTQSSQIEEKIAAGAEFLGPYVSTLVPAVVTIINSILPTVISLLTKLEKWDDVGFSIKAMVTRLYLAKILNVLIQLFSYALLLDPYLLTSTQTVAGVLTLDGSKVRKNVMIEFKSGAFACRAEQVASGLLTLVITDFTISKVAGIAAPLISVATAQATAKPEFLVPQKMVSLLYSCTIALLAIPLAPTAAMLSLGLHIVTFKFEKRYLMHFQRKPTSPWSAKDAGNFFIKFYFCTVIVFLGWTHYFLLNRYLPKLCSLQDSSLGPGDALCSAGSFVPQTEICTIRASHTSSGYAPITTAILATKVVSSLYSLVIESNFVVWALLGVVLLALFFLRNSIKVFVMLRLEREQEVELTFSSLKKKIRQLESRLRLHNKLGEDTASPTVLSSNPR